MNNKKEIKEIRILIVDDEIDFLDTMSAFLKGKGYSVLTAENGYKAIDIIKENSPDLVLLDIVMPDFDGIDTLKGIRRIAPELSVVMITAHASNEGIVEAIENGASGFIKKSSDFSYAAKLIDSLAKKIKSI